MCISFFEEIQNSKQNSPRWDGFAASHLGLFCLPMPHKKYVRLIWVKGIYFYILNCFTYIRSKPGMAFLHKTLNSCRIGACDDNMYARASYFMRCGPMYLL